MLDLRELQKGLPAITPALGEALAEASGVCLTERGHTQGTPLQVQGCATTTYALYWPAVTDQMLRSWNDPEVATEHGAVGVAVLLATRVTGHTVIERSRKGTGFDYWMGDDGDSLFQKKARLEVSGIRSGDERLLSARVRQKIKQTIPSDGALPAYVIVVEFGCPVAEVRKK
jgi:hypothetical protein